MAPVACFYDLQPSFFRHRRIALWPLWRVFNQSKTKIITMKISFVLIMVNGMGSFCKLFSNSSLGTICYKSHKNHNIYRASNQSFYSIIFPFQACITRNTSIRHIVPHTGFKPGQESETKLFKSQVYLFKSQIYLFKSQIYLFKS